MKMLLHLLLAFVVLAFPAAGQAEMCSARSGPSTAALVELYTSQGCDSCPPADRWLSGLRGQGYGPERVVPLSLHVDYWDYIGWKDPYAKREFATRQRKHAQMKRARIVYTPQVVLQGEDFRGWSGRDFGVAVVKINARPPRARISLSLKRMDGHAAQVEVAAQLLDTPIKREPALYLAAYENKLVTQVASGENRGRLLEHNFVVREWTGPLEFDPAGRLSQSRTLPLLPQADPKHSGIAAFVQDRSGGEVLQALMLLPCAQ